MPKNIKDTIDPELRPFVSAFPELDISPDSLSQTRALIRAFTPKPLTPAPQEVLIPSQFAGAPQIRALIYLPKGTPKAAAVKLDHDRGFGGAFGEIDQSPDLGRTCKMRRDQHLLRRGCQRFRCEGAD